MIQLDGKTLTIDQVVDAAKNLPPVSVHPEAKEKINQSQSWVQGIVDAGKPVYGINTGFGIFSDKQISNENIKTLNRNLIISHAVGTGDELRQEITRAAMLIRANTLSSGHSGIRLSVIESLLEMLNKGVLPSIPSQGSLGSSGDLAPLSHLALVLTKGPNDSHENSGCAYYKNERMTGKQAMQAAGIRRWELSAKEGLAITNGATFSAAIAALAVHQADILLENAEAALALSLEALLGASAAFDARIHHVRRQAGQSRVAERVRELISGSDLIDKGGRVQDSYSLRCAPQVHGPARDTFEFVRSMISNEINAVTDNPLIFDPGVAISGGNFHGEPVAMASDFLKIALSEIGAISERRTFQLTDPNFNAGLPPMLVDSTNRAGLNSGLMMPQYTAASLVLENKNLSTPDSIHSLPTSGGKEDHNANAMTAARNLDRVVENCAHIIAVELYTAARAVDLRLRDHPKAGLGKGTRQAYEKIRDLVPFQAGDALWGPEIEKIKAWVRDNKIA
ncbi:MAG: histidine ammonia-lyase [Anaerolineae bacterium]|nr:histidine ammonia-lyase [Anaerolineae bacterium]